MAERYGWTLEDIDRLGPEGRARVRYWWSTKLVWTEASRYLRQWETAQAANAKAFEALEPAPRTS